MGREVVYCFNCGVRLLSSDFEKGTAFRTGGTCACAKCLPLLLEMLPPEKREKLRGTGSGTFSPVAPPRREIGPASPTESSFARPGTTRRTRRIEEKGAPSGWRRRLPFAAVTGIALILAALWILLPSRRSPPSEEAGPSKEPHLPPVVPPPAAPERVGEAPGPRKEPPGKTPSELESLLGEIREPLEREEYGKVLRLLDREKDRNATPAWILQLDRRIDEVKEEAERKFLELKARAREARAKGEEEELARLRDRVGRWEIPQYAEDFERAFALPPPADVPRREPDRPAGRSEEGKAYLERWREAMRPATVRDYAAARKALEEAVRGLREETVQKEAEEDLRVLQAVEELFKAAAKVAGNLPEGTAVSFELLTRERVEGVIDRREADHLEIRVEGRKSVLFVDPAELTAPSLAKAADGADPRTKALWFLLEGEAEAARVLEAAGVPEKYVEYAREAREKAPRGDAPERRREREARLLLWEAARDFESMETRGAAIDRYRTLAKDYVDTAAVRKDIDLVTRRSEAGKEYFFLPLDLRGSGEMRLRDHPELGSCWVCGADVGGDAARARETYVEIDFYALPGAAYQGWVYAGACCEETFTVFYQATEMTGPNPRRPSEKIPYDVGAAAALPLPSKPKGLKKTHAQHGGEKRASRWEWLAVPLPKYFSGGLKKIRLLPEHQGFSVGMALVTSVHRSLPQPEELMEERRRALEALKTHPRRERGLVVRWTFDDVSEGRVKDATGRGLDGQIRGNPRPVPGRIGGALELDSGSWIEVPGFTWPSGGPVTVAFWNFVEPANVRKSIAFTAGGGDDRNRFLCHAPYEDRKLYWDYGDFHAKGRIAVDYTKHLGKWTHVALVSEGLEGRFKAIYLDGEMAASSGECEGPRVPLHGFRIGIPSESHLGRIDDFRIYNRALEISEIRRLSLGAP